MSTADPTTSATDVEGYVDLYLLPVPERNIEEYRRQALSFGSVVREHGALSYREFRGDDLQEGFSAGEGEVLTAAVVEFRSRAHRDEVMAKAMKDPRVESVAQATDIADMGQMRYGGFATFVEA